MQTIVIKKNGVEIGRISGEVLEFAKRSTLDNRLDTVRVDDPYLIAARTQDGTAFVVNVSKFSGYTMEREESLKDYIQRILRENPEWFPVNSEPS